MHLVEADRLAVREPVAVLAERLATKLGGSVKPLWQGGELYSVPQAGVACGLTLPADAP